MAEKVVEKYVYSGAVPVREKEDVMMSVVEKFLEKQERIANGFSGKAKISTYCIAVLNRMCCEVIRKQMMYWKFRSEEYIKENQSGVLSTSEKLVIQDEVDMLDKLLRTFYKEQDKIIIVLAYYFNLSPKESVFKKYAGDEWCHELMQFLEPKEKQNKAHLFENLARVINICEHNTVKADAVRMWLNKTMNKIIQRLNGPFQRASYDKESLRTLFEHFYLRRV